MLSLLFFVTVLQANADTAAVAAFVEENLARTETAIQSVETPLENDAREDGDAYFFRRFWLRARAKAGFKLPGTVKLQLVPEMEMLWDRAIPNGWTGYKPQK